MAALEVEEEIIRLRARVHDLEGKQVTVELLIKHLIDDQDQRMLAQDKRTANMKWIVGLAVASSPIVNQLVEKMFN